jgi:hypothetical protein
MNIRFLKSWFSKKSRNEPPEVPIFWTLQSVYLARAYYVVAELQIADRLRERPMTCAELAEATGCQERSLYRILRALAAFNVFSEDERGQFTITEQAGALLSDVHGSVRDWTVLTGRLPTWQAFGHALEVVQTGRNGFALAHGELGDLWRYCDYDADLGDTFIRAQRSWTAWHRDAILRAYDFSRFHSVIDVGGGSGALLAGILAQNTDIRGVLLDQPQVVERARTFISDLGLEHRCELIGGSFLEDIPADGDVYICKHVLRDWDDDNVCTILSNCHRAMSADAILLVIDAVIDPGNSRDRIVKLLDLEQMFWLNGALRTLDEWKSLLTTSGFRLVQTRSTEIVDAFILEAAKKT